MNEKQRTGGVVVAVSTPKETRTAFIDLSVGKFRKVPCKHCKGTGCEQCASQGFTEIKQM